MRVKVILVLGCLLTLFFFPSPSFSVDVAPRITDREIVERLTRLEEGQKASAQRLDDTNRRMEEGFKSLNQRIDDTNHRIDELRETLLWSSGVLCSGMLALVGFVLWDRRSALAPAVRQMEMLREREEKLEAALREYALKSPELAESLKKMGLL